MRALILALGCWLFSTTAFAQTAVPAGRLSADTRWTASGSPYILAGDVTVPVGVTLTVAENVIVQVSAVQSIIIDGGSLRVQGTEAAPVTLTTASAGTTWQGIVVSGGVLEVAHAHIDAARVAITATSVSGGLRSVTIPPGAPLEIRGGNLSFRDSEVPGVLFTGDGTTSAFRTIFRGEVSFNGSAAFVDHATFTSRVSGTSATTIFDSIIDGASSVMCRRCILDRVLITPVGASSDIPLDVAEIRHPLRQERPLLTPDFHPTEFSPARFRDTDGRELGARAYAGAATPRFEGWLWGGFHMTATNARPIDGSITVPSGTVFEVDPGLRVVFPVGADELRQTLQVYGSVVWGAARGPAVQVVGRPTVRGVWSIVLEGPTASIDMNHVQAVDTQVIASDGARVALTDVSMVFEHGEQNALEMAATSRFALQRTRVSNAPVQLHGSGTATNLAVLGLRTDALSLLAGNGESVRVIHATVTCSLSRTGITARTLGTGTIVLSNAVVGTGCAVGILGADAGLTLSTLMLGARMAAVGVTLPPGTLTVDPLLDTRGMPRSGSGCIDAASAAFSDPLDIDGVARPVDGNGDGRAAPDIGAFEVGRGTCGDGIVTGGERCDSATPRYGWDACASDCRGHGPYCGDGLVSAPDEQCDQLESCAMCRSVIPDAGMEDDAFVMEEDAFVMEQDAGAEPLDGGSRTDTGLALDAREVDARAAPMDVSGTDGGSAAPVVPGSCACSAMRPRGGSLLGLAFAVAWVLATYARRRHFAPQS